MGAAIHPSPDANAKGIEQKKAFKERWDYILPLLGLLTNILYTIRITTSVPPILEWGLLCVVLLMVLYWIITSWHLLPLIHDIPKWIPIAVISTSCWIYYFLYLHRFIHPVWSFVVSGICSLCLLRSLNLITLPASGRLVHVLPKGRLPVALIFLLISGLLWPGLLGDPVCDRDEQPHILFRLHGSNAIEIQLARALVTSFLQVKEETVSVCPCKPSRNSKNEVIIRGISHGSPVGVEIEGHGSARGFSDLMDKRCDIVMGVKPPVNMDSKLSRRLLGSDGVAIIVSQDNPVERLSQEEIRKIFAGEIRKWGHVQRSEGQNDPINLYAMDAESDEWEAFKARIMNAGALHSELSSFDDNAKLASKVAADSNGIGFVALPLKGNAKAIQIGESHPSEQEIVNQKYPLWRRLYLFTLPDDGYINPEVEKFLDFATSDPGQAIVRDNHFFNRKSEISPLSLADRYKQLIKDADKIDKDFHFDPNNSDLNPKLNDVEQIIKSAQAFQNRGREILLLGFTDDRLEQVNMTLSIRRAQSVARGFRSHGLNVADSDILGFGAEVAIAPNDTVEGRAQNRRVEIWLRR